MKPFITVVSLGPGDPDLLNHRTLNILKSGTGRLVLRTGLHPAVKWLEGSGIGFETFDGLFQSSEDFDTLNLQIAELLWTMARREKVIYAVPDSNTDRSVVTLYRQKPADAEIETVPGTGSIDVLSALVKSECLDMDFRIVPASDLSLQEYDPNISLLITEMDNPIQAGLVKVFLTDRADDETEVLLLESYRSVLRIPLYELDRQPHYDHQTAVLVPGSDYLSRNRFSLQDLSRIMERLRSPDGCPWDRIQTHESLRPYIIEEAWECIASIDEKNPYHLSEELGDLLFQIVFHASIGADFDEFTLTDVISSICSKMIRRHPHVFSAGSSSSPPDWESVKQAETGNRTVLSSLEDVPEGLPGLNYAAKTLKKADRIPQMKRTAAQTLAELKTHLSVFDGKTASFREADLGRLLFLCAELCYRSHMDGELILHQAVGRFKSKLRDGGKEEIKHPES